MSLEYLQLPPGQWLALIACGLLIGTAKAGISGAGLMVVPILAHVFGGKPSTGLMLPMLIFADIYAVRHYRRHASPRHVARLLPWAAAGVLLGVWVGGRVSELTFQRIMAVLIFVGIAVMIRRDMIKSRDVPDSRLAAPVTGLSGGFATMMGNAAGPIMALYLLAMRLPKLNFIGTAAWFFFLINLFKLPFHILFWKTVTPATLALNLAAAPAVLAGVWLGIRIVRVFPERGYRILVIATTTLSALLLFG